MDRKNTAGFGTKAEQVLISLVSFLVTFPIGKIEGLEIIDFFLINT